MCSEQKTVINKLVGDTDHIWISNLCLDLDDFRDESSATIPMVFNDARLRVY